MWSRSFTMRPMYFWHSVLIGNLHSDTNSVHWHILSYLNFGVKFLLFPLKICIESCQGINNRSTILTSLRMDHGRLIVEILSHWITSHFTLQNLLWVTSPWRRSARDLSVLYSFLSARWRPVQWRHSCSSLHTGTRLPCLLSRVSACPRCKSESEVRKNILTKQYIKLVYYLFEYMQSHLSVLALFWGNVFEFLKVWKVVCEGYE